MFAAHRYCPTSIAYSSTEDIHNMLCCLWPQNLQHPPELLLSSFKRQLKTHRALPSAGSSFVSYIPSSSRVVTAEFSTNYKCTDSTQLKHCSAANSLQKNFNFQTMQTSTHTSPHQSITVIFGTKFCYRLATWQLPCNAKNWKSTWLHSILVVCPTALNSQCCQLKLIDRLRATIWTPPNYWQTDNSNGLVMVICNYHWLNSASRVLISTCSAPLF